MGWGIGKNSEGRDIGYGISAICDHPKCNEAIDRGLSYLCGGENWDSGKGCGLYFCSKHLYLKNYKTKDESFWLCPKCYRYDLKPYQPKPDTLEWLAWKLLHPSWQEWRDGNPETVKEIEKLCSEKSEEFEQFKSEWESGGWLDDE